MPISKPPRKRTPSVDIEDTFHKAKEEKRKTTSIRMYPSLMKYLSIWARQNDTTASDVLEKAVLEYMDVTLEEATKK